MTIESLTAALRDENAVDGDEAIPCEYMTLSHEYIEYTDGMRLASATADFTWDNGQCAIEVSLEADLEYSGSQWLAESVQIVSASHPVPKAALPPDESAELIRAAVEANGAVAGETVEVTADSVSEDGGFADIAAQYVAREGECLHTTTVSGRFEYSPEQGYRLFGDLSLGEESCRPEQEINVLLSTPFQLNASDTFPVGQASSGQAETTVFITTDGQADISMDFGQLVLLMTGKMSGNTPEITYTGET